MRAIVVALGLSVCVLVAGCGQKSDKDKTVTISGNDGNVTIAGNNEHMVVKSADGNATVDINANGIARANMPDFAPLYPGAKVTSSISGDNSRDGTTGAMVMFTVAAAPADVIAFYKQKADAAGLPQTMSADVNNTVMFSATKDKKTITVSATKSNDTTQVQVVWGSGK
jgi:hypothetical protein